MLNLPNFLTLVRIIAIPFFLVLLSYELYLTSFIILVLGGLTDFLDGAIARMTNQQTPLGAYLDPVADKLLVISSFVMLGLSGVIPAWVVIVVVSRDFIILFGYAMIYYLVEERLQVQPSMIGKFSTLLQIVTVATVLLRLHDSSLFDAWLSDWLVLATALVTVASGFQYVYRGLVWLQSKAPSLTRLS